MTTSGPKFVRVDTALERAPAQLQGFLGFVFHLFSGGFLTVSWCMLLFRHVTGRQWNPASDMWEWEPEADMALFVTADSVFCEFQLVNCP